MRSRSEEKTVHQQYGEDWDAEKDKQCIATTNPAVVISEPKRKYEILYYFCYLSNSVSMYKPIVYLSIMFWLTF